MHPWSRRLITLLKTTDLPTTFRHQPLLFYVQWRDFYLGEAVAVLTCGSQHVRLTFFTH